MKTSVVIITWNKKDLLKNCLKALDGQNFKDFQTIIVDNHSTDGTSEFVKNNYPKIKIISLGKNFGFSRGANEGIKMTNSEYVILLNNDTFVDKNFVGNLTKALDDHKEYCGCTAKMIDFSNRNLLASAGDLMNDVGQSFPRGFGQKKNQFDKPEEVFLITGGASIYRKKVFQKIGLFDEDYFIYGEDSDWCFRAQLAGCKFWYEPKAIVYHYGKASSKKMAKTIDYYQFRNMTMTILKNFPKKLFFKKYRFLTIPLVHLNTIFYMMIKGCLKEALRADFWLLTHFPQIMKKRHLIQSKIKVDIEYLNHWLQPKKLRFYGLIR